MTVEFKDVTAALTAEGLKVDANEEDSLWGLSIDIGSQSQRAVLILPEAEGYFIAASMIQPATLSGKLEKIPLKAMRVILRAQSMVLLSKFHLVEVGGRTIYMTMSPCSTVHWSGDKLRKRLYACAELAVAIETALAAERAPSRT